MKEFLMQRELDQNFLKQELDAEKNQINDGYESIFNEIEEIRIKKLYLAHDKNKVRKARHKLRGDRRDLFELERALLLRDQAFKDEYSRLQRFLDEMNR
jgi:hypothetical protein